MAEDVREADLSTRETASQRSFALWFFLLIAIVVLYAFGLILSAFITPILLGGVIVVLTFRMFKRVRERVGGRPTIAAIIMLLFVNLVIILPTALLIVLLIDQAISLLRILQQTDVSSLVSSVHVADWISRYLPGANLPAIDLQREVLDLVKRIPSVVAVAGGRFLAGFANIFISYFFMLFAIYYFYVEGEYLVDEVRYLSPLPDRYDQELISKFKQVIDATFRGHVLTALAQGTVTGIGMAIAQIPGSIFWGAVATVFALIPLLGAAIVWVPAAGYLFLRASNGTGSFGLAIFLVLWGLFVVSLIDNVIRPWAMRGGTEMSAVLLLFSILGGIRVFGFMGIILGPLVFALFVSIVHIYKSFFQKTLERQDPEPSG